MDVRTIIKIQVSHNINSIRKNLTKAITGLDYVNGETVSLEVGGTTINAFTQPYEGKKLAARIYSSSGYSDFANIIEIEMEGEGTKEIVVDFVKRVQAYFANSKDRTNYRVVDYGLEVRQTVKKQNYTDFTGSLL